MITQESKFLALHFGRLKNFITMGPTIFNEYVTKIDSILGNKHKKNLCYWEKNFEKVSIEDATLFKAINVFFSLLDIKDEKGEYVFGDLKTNLLKFSTFQFLPQPNDAKAISKLNFDFLVSTIFEIAGINNNNNENFDKRKVTFVKKFSDNVYETRVNDEGKEYEAFNFDKKVDKADTDYWTGVNLHNMISFAQQSRNKYSHGSIFLPAFALDEILFFTYSCVTIVYFILKKGWETNNLVDGLTIKDNYYLSVKFKDVKNDIKIDGKNYIPEDGVVHAKLTPFTEHILVSEGEEYPFSLDEFCQDAEILPPNRIDRMEFIRQYSQDLFRNENVKDEESLRIIEGIKANVEQLVKTFMEAQGSEEADDCRNLIQNIFKELGALKQIEEVNRGVKFLVKSEKIKWAIVIAIALAGICFAGYKYFFMNPDQLFAQGKFEAAYRCGHPDAAYFLAVEQEKAAQAMLLKKMGKKNHNYEYANDDETRNLVRSYSEWYRKAIKSYEENITDGNDSISQVRLMRLVQMYQTGKGGEINAEKALEAAKRLPADVNQGILAFLTTELGDREESEWILQKLAFDGIPFDDYAKLAWVENTLYKFELKDSERALDTLAVLTNSEDYYVRTNSAFLLAEAIRSGRYIIDGKPAASLSEAIVWYEYLCGHLFLSGINNFSQLYYNDFYGCQGTDFAVRNCTLLAWDMGLKRIAGMIKDMIDKGSSLANVPNLNQEVQKTIKEEEATDPLLLLRQKSLAKSLDKNELAMDLLDSAMCNLDYLTQIKNPIGFVFETLDLVGTEAFMDFFDFDSSNDSILNMYVKPAMTDYFNGLCYAFGLHKTPIDKVKSDSLIHSAADGGISWAQIHYADILLGEVKQKATLTRELIWRYRREKRDDGLYNLIAKIYPDHGASTVYRAEKPQQLKEALDYISLYLESESPVVAAYAMRAYIHEHIVGGGLVSKDELDEENLRERNYWHKKAFEENQIDAVLNEIRKSLFDLEFNKENLKEYIRLLELALAKDNFNHRDKCAEVIGMLEIFYSVFGDIEAADFYKTCYVPMTYQKKEVQADHCRLLMLSLFCAQKDDEAFEAYVDYCKLKTEGSKLTLGLARDLYLDYRLFFMKREMAGEEELARRLGGKDIFAGVRESVSDEIIRKGSFERTLSIDISYPRPTFPF